MLIARPTGVGRIAHGLAAASRGLCGGSRMPGSAAHALARPSLLPAALAPRTSPLAPAVSPLLAAPLGGHTQRRFAVVNLRPKNPKYRKAFKGFFKTRSGGSIRGTTVVWGEYGLQAFEGGRLKDKQLDSVRTMVRRVLKPEKGARFNLRIMPHRPVTAKGAQTRMGKGKGAVDYYATWVSPGAVLFEIKGARREVALKALDVAAQALPIRTRVVEKNPDMPYAPRLLPYFVLKRIRDEEFAKFGAIKGKIRRAAARRARRAAIKKN
ncbi:39S ribosomal protein L16, mitochondrial [Polyrhizophydium stewartii]|uniref:39S ribosomal protein L16, mitochondrial n=1 Tax=Polyrhizophydium stewartii TaxID=2732419 RepID=A0ABR4MWZ1_9FUNG